MAEGTIRTSEAAAEAAAGGGTVPGGAPGDAARAVPNGAQGGA